jgi:tagatose-6-phosphate ketose/aldose isomerase
VDPLTDLIELPEDARKARGLTDTPREIHQQPETWLNTFARLQSMRSSIASICGELGVSAALQRFSQVILAGAGSSDYVGRALAGLLQQRWGCPVRSIPSTDLLTSLEEHILPEGLCLLISFSRSGESSEGIALLDLAKQLYPERIRHLVITCNAAGAMAQMPGVVPIVLDDAVNDRGLAMTSSFTNMLIAGQYLAYFNQEQTFATLVQALATMGKSLLPTAAELTAKLAKKGFRRVCFLGSGALQAAAQESALKVLELNAGKIATLAESFLGLRHGPMSFLNRKTLVCAYLSGDEPRDRYELDVLAEIRSKRLAGEVLVVAPRNSDRIRAAAGHVVDLQAPQGFPDSMRPAVDMIVGQLLALFLSIENGVRPDTPSTGAISRVVSHVKIYTAAATGRN